MDKKEILKRKRKRNRLIKSFVLVVAFVIAISATFGVTMAYFGGKSGTANYNMQLKMGLYVGIPTASTNTASTYVVPSQVVTANCEFKVKSGDKSGNVVTGDSASDGLIRAKIEFTGITGVTLDNGTANQVYFPVILDDDNDDVVANFVKYTDGYYYLITGTTISDSASMYVVDSSSGEKTFNFDLRVSVPKSLTNDNAGDTITLNVTYEVIQADFFKDSTTAQTKNVKNAAEVFGDTTIQNGTGAGYTYGS